MTKPPEIGKDADPETLANFAREYREAAESIASLLGSTRDPVKRERYEFQLQQALQQARHYEKRAVETKK